MSRDPAELSERMKPLWEAFDAKMKEAGIDYILTCTGRTKAEQAELYAQGRTKPGKIVTWTMNSKHIKGDAFDIAVKVSGKVSWDPINYQRPGMIGESVGLTWGGLWKGKPDYPHFEI